jgi:hypothetical protein
MKQLTLLLFFAALQAFAQVEINTTVSHLSSTSHNVNFGGFLPPKVTLALSLLQMPKVIRPERILKNGTARIQRQTSVHPTTIHRFIIANIDNSGTYASNFKILNRSIMKTK